ncbi:MAG: copper chaperone PCu(A)C [Geminicoccaceae bacterium]
MTLTRFAGLAVALLAVPALAHHDGHVFQAGDLHISHIWTEETGETAHAIEVYLTVENEGDTADRLIAAQTEFSQPGVFQASVLGADGALQVADVPSIEIAPGQMITFQPGGVHIVFNDVQRHLEGGEHFDMVLTFEQAGVVEVEVEIEHHDDHDHDHDHEDEAA